MDYPLGCLCEPEDVAYGILYLASDEAKFVTGAHSSSTAAIPPGPSPSFLPAAPSLKKGLPLPRQPCYHANEGTSITETNAQHGGAEAAADRDQGKSRP